MMTTIPAPATTEFDPEGVAARAPLDLARFAKTLADLESYVDSLLEGFTPPSMDPGIESEPARMR